MSNLETKRYDYLIIDAVNFAYRTFKTKEESPILISKKYVYKDSINNFIFSLDNLKEKYLAPNGEIYLLFDNYFSRADLKSMFQYADRKQLSEAYKANRKKESKEFYNSINFIRYYYMVAPKEYRTIRIDNLEADDLVEPLLDNLDLHNTGKSALFITTDMDWLRYVDTHIDWLPHLDKVPESVGEVSEKLGFDINKVSIIIYKALFGDVSDNIKGIVPKNEENFKEFKDIIEHYTSAESLLTDSRVNKNSSKILKAISERESDYIRNIQLVSTIPCSSQALSYQTVIGRDEKHLYSTIRKVIGLEGNAKFVFGGIKRSRIS